MALDFTNQAKAFPAYDFTPAYSPERMLELGVFDGAYFSKATPADLIGLSSAVKRVAREQIGKRPDPSLNAFGVHSGLPLRKWIDKGWIRGDDTLGWFHWYCRFYHGRRDPRVDEWQISRWRRYAERWRPEIKRRDNERKMLVSVERQGLLHWSHNPFSCDGDQS